MARPSDLCLENAWLAYRLMIGALLTIGASLVGAWIWWIKNRAKTRRQIDDEQIEYARKLRETELDSWWHRRS